MIKKQETRPIGSQFMDHKYGLLEVVESDEYDCEECVYNQSLHICTKGSKNAGPCTSSARKDGKYVKFIPKKMSEFETRPVGSVFHHPEHGLLQVVESYSCDGCVFYNKAQIIPCQADISVGFCTEEKREDKISVIFKQYTKNGKQSGR